MRELKVLNGGLIEETGYISDSPDNQTLPSTTKTDLGDIQFLIENFPYLDEYYHFETESFKEKKKKDIDEIKGKMKCSKNPPDMNPVLLQYYNLFLRDLDQNPGKALFFINQWLNLGGSSNVTTGT